MTYTKEDNIYYMTYGNRSPWWTKEGNIVSFDLFRIVDVTVKESMAED